MRAERVKEPGFSLPAGTVTFLLADVEGSVRRWEADQAAMAGDLALLEEVLAGSIGGHGGVRPVEQGEGDSAVGAFARASDAFACALGIQRRLASELPGIRLRVALHTGEAQRRDGGRYFGRAINRCARLRDLAHGGQTLLSRATHDLVLDRLPEGAWLEDLGIHRLRDLARPEQVFQLRHPDLPGEFPPLRSLDALPHNLPVQLTTFIGRESEIAEIGRFLSESRMVTLTGSGGCGKTRLALQAAAYALDGFPDGVWWVDLAPVSDPALVPSAVGAALSVREVPLQPLVESISGDLRTKRALLILDNCEHLVEGCAAFAGTILRSCPGVSVLATSRHTIDVEGEVAFRVPSLRLPEEGEPEEIEALTQYEAVQLFIDRALRARPNFRVTNDNAPAVAHICHRLDGIPLAIELAAARVRVLSPERIASELTDVFHVLAAGARTAVPRHQTLRASVEWSHGLLTGEERGLLRRLSVFAGGFTLDAAEAVGAGEGLERSAVLDVLSSLVDKSLVQVEEGAPEVRYRLLETIRQHGTEKLSEAGEGEAVRTRHLDFFVALAEEAALELEGAGMIEWVRMLRAEHDNTRAALDWGLASRQPDKALRLAGALRLFWMVTGRWREARARYEALLSEEIGDPAVLARGLLGASTNCFQLFDWPAAYGFAEKALSIAREIDDRQVVARAQSLIGTARMWSGDFEAGRPLCEEAIDLGREVGDRYTVAMAHFGLANGAWVDQGDLVRARAAFEQALTAARESGNPQRLGMILVLYGMMTGWMDPQRSEPLLKEAVDWLDQLGEVAVRGVALAWLGWARLMRGDYDGALDHAAEALRLDARAEYTAGMAEAHFVLGWLHRATGDLQAADAALEQSANLGRETNLPWACYFWVLGALVRVRLERADLAGAQSALEATAEIPEPSGVYAGFLADARARLARERGDLERAEALAHEALASLARAAMKPAVVDLLELVAWAAAAHESHSEAARLFGAAQAARDAIRYVRFPSERERYEGDVALARSGLPDEEFEKAWAEGTALSLEEAVAYAQRGRGERKRPSHGWASLSPTEIQVAGLVAERLTNPQIAQRLFVSRGTVKTHLSHIYDKLGIESRAELADEVAKRQTA